MIDNHRAAWDRNTPLEDFAAELARAAYPLVLRHGPMDSWLKLELGLWRALAKTVETWAWRRPLGGSVKDFAAWRESFLWALTASAFAVALNYGVNGSRPEVESGLYQVFQQVIRSSSHAN